MLTTSIRHGDLVIDIESDRSVRIVRQSNAQSIELSYSEWIYVLKVAEIHDWPVAPPSPPSQV